MQQMIGENTVRPNIEAWKVRNYRYYNTARWYHGLVEERKYFSYEKTSLLKRRPRKTDNSNVSTALSKGITSYLLTRPLYRLNFPLRSDIPIYRTLRTGTAVIDLWCWRIKQCSVHFRIRWGSTSSPSSKIIHAPSRYLTPSMYELFE